MQGQPWSVASIALLAGLASGCSRGQAESPAGLPPPQVVVARVATAAVDDWNDFTGRLEAASSVAVHPRVGGYVESVNFEEGARVERGALLFRIDSRPFQHEVARLSAEHRRAQSQLELSRVNRERSEQLAERNTIARGELDDVVAAHAAASAALDAIDASLAAARLNLDFTRIRAPISGRVSRALVTPGNLVSNASLLTTLVSDGEIHAYFGVDETVYLKLSREAVQARKVRLGLSDEPDFPHAGVLDFFDNALDPRTGTIRARAVFANPDGRLVPGLFARVRVRGDKPVQAALIDDKAILTDQDRKYVYVLDEKSRAQRRNIRIGRMFEGLRVATEGLTAGDRVIVYGVQKVFSPGMPVQPIEIAMGAPPPTTKAR